MLFTLPVFSLGFSPISSRAFLLLSYPRYLGEKGLHKALAHIEHCRQLSLAISAISENLDGFPLFIGKFPALVEIGAGDWNPF